LRIYLLIIHSATYSATEIARLATPRVYIPFYLPKI